MTIRETKDAEQLERRANALFERSVAEIDATERARLREARREALAELRRPVFAAPRNLGFAAAAAAAAVVLLVMLQSPQSPAPAAVDAQFGTMVAADLELLLGDEELDMLAELEFYSWLDNQALGEGTEETQDGVG
jgi:hypothetical protein